MNVIKDNLISKWSWSRIIRLVLGCAFVYDSINSMFVGTGVIGLVLILQALINVGCNSSSCEASPTTQNFKKSS